VQVQMAIRLATAADHALIGRVFARASLSNEGDRENLLAHPELLEFDAAVFDNGGTRVAVVDGLVVGFATLRLVDDMAAELDDLFVDPDWMRQGIARALVSDLVEAAKRRGFARIDVAANGHAVAFYEAAGFIADGTVETTFGSATHMHLNVV
jgi:ribosomal protein S18 acetylase RimI-like enzyme